jgi:hypothetical protein
MATRRAKPAVPKAGVTKNRSRRYGCGGKMSKGNSYKCGGKISKK